MALPRNVVREDHRLEDQAEKTSSALAELRWHWTLDETNAKRISISEYAKTVGRQKSTIHKYVHGFAISRTSDMPLGEAIERANMSANRATATEAVAKARGTTFTSTRQARPSEVRRVLAIATEKAEEKGTSIEEEAPKVAKWIVKAEKAADNIQAARTEKVDLRLIEAEGKALRMIRMGVELLGMIRAVEWDDEAVELLEETVGKLRALVGLIDVALVGAADVDWDAELSKLTEEVA